VDSSRTYTKSEQRASKGIKFTVKWMLVNVGLTIFKMIAGFLGHSSAMIADAFHSLSDFATDIAVIFGFFYVKKPADHCHNYGHGKYETLITLLVGLALAIVGFEIGKGASEKIFLVLGGGTLGKPGVIAFIAAIVSIITKEIMYRVSFSMSKKLNSPALLANAWHHRSDALSSVGTFLGIGGAIILGDKWHILDPIAGLIVSFFILYIAIKISLRAISELLEMSLGKETEDAIFELVKNTDGIINPHNLKTRRIGAYIAIDIHIEVDPNLSVNEAHLISTKAEHSIYENFGNDTFINIHIEPYNDVDSVNEL
jgi:cation diffusion facilitator family transporter